MTNNNPYPAACGGISQDGILFIVQGSDLKLRFLASIEDLADVAASLTQPDLTVVLSDAPESNRK
jgi:hypothetical protein